MLVTERLSHAPTIGYLLRKQSRLQTVPTLARSRGQGSMFNTPPLLGAAVDTGLCNGTGAQRGGIGYVAAGRPPAAEGMPHAASTACTGCIVAAGGPPTAEGTPHAASTACTVCAGTPPAAEGAPRAASTACVVGGVAAGGPPTAEGRPCVAGTACAVRAGTPPAAEGRPCVAGTACAVCAGTPLAAEGRSRAVGTACGGLVSVGMPPTADCPQITSTTNLTHTSPKLSAIPGVVCRVGTSPGTQPQRQ